MKIVEKYRFVISVLLGILLSSIVILLWNVNSKKIRRSLEDKVSVTGSLIVQQFQAVLEDNVNQLENLKRRLEITKGDYFKYWNSDAELIIDQEPSFLFVEWIDSSMVIQKIEPLEGNEEALGLDISGIGYRNEGWNKARRDSIYNVTHWLELVQGDSAFLVDAPVYIENDFYGTITAGMDFSTLFDGIVQGLDEYHIRITDDKEATFYTHGTSEGTASFQNMTVTDSIRVGDADNSIWTITMVPNHFFQKENSVTGNVLILALALFLCLLIAVGFYFMQKSSAAEKSSLQANQKLRALIDSSPIAIYVLNFEGVVVDLWNDAAERMLGWKREEVLGRFLPHVAKDHIREFGRLLEHIKKEGGLTNIEITRNRKDGSKGAFRLNVGTIAAKDQQMLVLLEDITKEKEYEEKLKRSLHEKEVLLAEIHHRVKNNLAIIIGLIELHKEEVDDAGTRSLLNETQNRIYSIAGVHELLYQTESFSEIGIGEYIDKLIDRMQFTYKTDERKVSIDRDISSFHVNINQAIPLGLLLNELITNSFKHAFDGVENARISIEILEKNDVLEVHYKDNGNGFDASVFEKTNTLGMTLIKTLLDQLSAEFTIDDQPGFDIKFRFKVKEKGAHSNI